MPKRTVEQYKDELEDKIKDLVNRRNQLIIDADRISKDLEPMMEQLLALDDTKVKIVCLICGGKGYIPTEDGKKQVCPQGHPVDKPYMWATKYMEPTTQSNSTDYSK